MYYFLTLSIKKRLIATIEFTRRFDTACGRLKQLKRTEFFI